MLSQPFPRYCLAIGVTAFLPASARAQLPGFELVRVTNDSQFNAYMDLNDCGQLVFIKRFDQDWNLSDLYFYDNGRTFRLTEDDVGDIVPSINNGGTIVWARDTDRIGDTDTIVVYDDGLIFELAKGTWGASQPVMNDSGLTVWSDWLGSGCRRSDADIVLTAGGNHNRLTSSGGLSNQAPILNNLGHVVFMRCDFCSNPWISDPMLFRDGQLQVLPHLGQEPQLPDINGRGEVVWMSLDEQLNWTIERWHEGHVEIIAQPGQAPLLDQNGRIVFSYGQVFLYEDGQIEQVTFEPEITAAHAFNAWGEIAMGQRIYPYGDVLLMRRTRTGDADFDGDKDLVDHARLAACLTGPDGLERRRMYPTDTLCECRFMDLDYDNDVDVRDWAAFQNAFTLSK